MNHRSVTWQSWSDVKSDYPSASLVGSCVIFNIGRVIKAFQLNKRAAAEGSTGKPGLINDWAAKLVSVR